MTDSSTPETLNSLVKLISVAVQDIIGEYKAQNQTIPSLDSVTPGPFDSPEHTSLKLNNAIQIVEAACAQLCATVANPGHTIVNKAYAFEEPTAMQVVVSAKIADLLDDKPQGLSVAVLSKQCGIDEDKLGRLLRLLATKHCFREVKPNVFANNRLSVKLKSSDPVSGLVGHITDETQKASSYLYDTLADPLMGPSLLPSHAPFKKAHGSSAFEYYATAEGKKRSDRFAQAMVGWGDVTGKGILKKVYPWSTLPAGVTICDVGGNNGHVTLDLVKTFPKLKIIVQDLPHALEQANQLWTENVPEIVKAQDVKFVPLDFFNEAPVEGCDFYYIRHVLHDWQDAECLKILANVKKAMKPESRILIHEFVLQHLVRDESGASAVQQAPEPLLPNYGVGRVRLYNQDINMMCNLNSKERTLPEFIELGKAAGLKFEKIWDSGETSLVELSADL